MGSAPRALARLSRKAASSGSDVEAKSPGASSAKPSCARERAARRRIRSMARLCARRSRKPRSSRTPSSSPGRVASLMKISWRASRASAGSRVRSMRKPVNASAWSSYRRSRRRGDMEGQREDAQDGKNCLRDSGAGGLGSGVWSLGSRVQAPKSQVEGSPASRLTNLRPKTQDPRPKTSPPRLTVSPTAARAAPR